MSVRRKMSQVRSSFSSVPQTEAASAGRRGPLMKHARRDRTRFTGSAERAALPPVNSVFTSAHCGVRNEKSDLGVYLGEC